MTYVALLMAINAATIQLQGRAAVAVNQSLGPRNWMVRARILEFEQVSRDRARYGQLIPYTLSTESPTSARQMNRYVNWSKARLRAEGDAPPVGILLCSDKDGAEVEFATAGMDQKLFVSRYLTALPSAKRLRAFLESDRAHFESRTPLRQSIKRLPKRTRGGS